MAKLLWGDRRPFRWGRRGGGAIAIPARSPPRPALDPARHALEIMYELPTMQGVKEVVVNA